MTAFLNLLKTRIRELLNITKTIIVLQDKLNVSSHDLHQRREHEMILHQSSMENHFRQISNITEIMSQRHTANVESKHAEHALTLLDMKDFLLEKSYEILNMTDAMGNTLLTQSEKSREKLLISLFNRIKESTIEILNQTNLVGDNVLSHVEKGWGEFHVATEAAILNISQYLKDNTVEILNHTNFVSHTILTHADEGRNQLLIDAREAINNATEILKENTFEILNQSIAIGNNLLTQAEQGRNELLSETKENYLRGKNNKLESRLISMNAFSCLFVCHSLSRHNQ